jgi:hypothetical protein
MKQTRTASAPPPRTLQLHRETVRTLRGLADLELADVRGAAMHTSFSCGADLCTTHAPTG